MKHLKLLVCSFVLLGACARETQPPATTHEHDELVAPGEATEVVMNGEFSYETRAAGTGDDEAERYGLRLCEHARLGGTTVIAEILPGSKNLSEGIPVCDNDYSEPAIRVPLRVLGNVAGKSLPSQLDTTLVLLDWNNGTTVAGKQILVTLREDAGEWIWLAWVEIDISPDGTGVMPLDRTVGDLPTTFAEMSTKLQDLNTDWRSKCAGDSFDDLWGWPDYVRDPAVWYESCQPGYVAPDVGPEPTRDAGR